MKDYLANKTVGFYISVVACVLALVALVLYLPTTGALALVIGLLVAAICVEVLLIVLSKVIGNKPVLNLASSINAVLLGFAIVTSFNPQLDPIGYVVSGLYTFDQIRGFVNFVIVAAIAFLLYIVASFMSLGKQK